MRNVERETAFQSGVHPFRNALSSLGHAGLGLLDDFEAAEEYLLTLTEELPLVHFSPLSPLSDYSFPEEDTGSEPAGERPTRRVELGREGAISNPQRPASSPESPSSAQSERPLTIREAHVSVQGNPSQVRSPVFSLRRDNNRREPVVGSARANQHQSSSPAGSPERTPRQNAESGDGTGPRSAGETPAINAVSQRAYQSRPLSEERLLPPPYSVSGQSDPGASSGRNTLADGPGIAGAGISRPLELLNTLADSVLKQQASQTGSSTQRTGAAEPNARLGLSSQVGESGQGADQGSDTATFLSGTGSMHHRGVTSQPDSTEVGREAGVLPGSAASRRPVSPGQIPTGTLGLIDSLVQQLWSTPQTRVSVTDHNLEQIEPSSHLERRLPIDYDFQGVGTSGVAPANWPYRLNGDQPSGMSPSGFDYLRNGRGDEDETRPAPPDLDTVIASLTNALIEEARRHGVDLS